MDQFVTHGWIRVPGAFSTDAAAAMREVTWHALEQVGIRRDDRSTWHRERPDHLQHLKSDPAFGAVASDRTLAAIDEVLDGQPWTQPKDWGAFFLVFPTTGRTWSVPTTTWHLDAPYTDPLTPPAGVKVHAMYGDVEPGAGAMCILDGSHRAVHRWFVDNPPMPGAPAAKLRKTLLRDSGVLDLPVVENTAEAGDVILMHPLLLHAPPTAHTGAQPRFLLNKDLRV